MGRPRALMQGGNGQVRRLRELPGGEGIDGVESALKNGSGGVEEGIVEGDWRREIYVEGAD